MTIGERIKNLRISAGLTQEELAQRIGVKKQNISRYENGRVEPNIRTAKKIADALGVTIEEMAVGVSVLPPLTLTPDETQLVTDYRSLTRPGQEYIRQTMAMAKQSYSGKNDALPSLEEAT